MIRIREYQPTDWPALLPILRETFAAGDTYTFPPDISDSDIHKNWIEVPRATLVACGESGELLGSYFIKPNQPGLGDHVCNCGYVVLPSAQGQGVATRMCEDSQQRALGLGFRAMQFNIVVSTNHRAVRLWQRLGFTTVGRLPGAFRHQESGFVDAFVMYKQLGAPMKITVAAVVKAPIERVWNAWTTPADIIQWNTASKDWHTPRATVDLREGGSFSSRMEARDGSMGFDFAGTYTRIVKHELIECAFGDRTMQVLFSEGPGGVTVTETFDAETTHSLEQQRQGWQAILDNFARHVEQRPQS